MPSLQATRNWKERNADRVREYGREYYAANSERHRELVYALRRKHPERHRAQKKVARAVKSGRLVRPDGCEECPWKGKPHGHHEDYSKPLEVIWLCPRCHRRRHGHL